MPRVEVTSEGPESRIMLTEHVPSEMFADDHYAEQLVARMGWALIDAEKREQAIPA